LLLLPLPPPVPLLPPLLPLPLLLPSPASVSPGDCPFPPLAHEATEVPSRTETSAVDS
jgi:hypothetical protein